MADSITDTRDAQNAYRALGEDPKSYTLAVSTSAASTVQMDPGEYLMWLPGGLPTDAIVWKRGATNTASVPTPDATGVAAHQLPADKSELVRVTSAEPYLWVKTLSASGTLRLSKVGP